MELAVNVTTYSDRSIDSDHIALFYQQFTRLVA